MAENSFKLCLTMAGAVSAGAYTAGVIDELLSALDRWEKAKARNMELGSDHPGFDHSIPMHHVEIEVMSGASAGGITATLALKKMLDARSRSMESNTLLHDCWVIMADEPEINTLEKLLDTGDLNKSTSPGSLLNPSPVEDLAEQHLRPLKDIVWPTWLSPDAEVILTTTNLEGIHVNVHFNGIEGAQSGHMITQHSSVFRFTPAGNPTGNNSKKNPYRYTADLRSERDTEILKNAALSTSAFPVGLPSRQVKLPHEPYLKYLAEDGGKSNLRINLPPQDHEHSFSAIDGGLLNNEPYGWALKVLREKNKTVSEENRYAVIMIDPLPVHPDRSVEKHTRGLWNTFTAMFRALRNEVMLNQEGIAQAISLQDRTKFLVAPRKGGTYPEKLNVLGKVLASSPLSGFAGFISRQQREHDYELGQRNCRDFLRFHFTMPVAMANQRLDKTSNTHMQDRFCIIPRNPATKEELHFPVIPDVRLEVARTHTLKREFIETQEYPVLPEFRIAAFINSYQSLIDKRLCTLVKGLSKKWWITLGFRIFLLRGVRKKIYGVIENEMQFCEREEDPENRWVNNT